MDISYGEFAPECLLDHVERIDELAELDDAPVAEAHEVGDVEAQLPVRRELPERDVVMQHGGVIKLAPHIDGISTTDLIARILKTYAE